MEILTQGDLVSPTWSKIENHLNDRLASARRALENPNTDEKKTQTLRGRIVELKYLLSLANEQPIVDKIDE